MKTPRSVRWWLVLAGTVLGVSAKCVAGQPVPLVHAHAHNDYLHQRPLLDALDHGFCSVEADVWLVNGRLLVAHDKDKVIPERTLEALYLDPLREWVKRNGGRVFPDGPPVTLLIDVKSDAEPTYTALREALSRYADMLTVFRANVTETKAVTVILSGNRALNAIAREEVRFAALDGRLDDLEGSNSRHLMPLISDRWSTAFQWRGVGELPAEEKQKLKDLVSKAHAQGRRIRFWSAPDSPPGWRELLAAGVDLINTDNLEGLEDFLRAAR
jgi:hypothetical protein